MKIETDYTLLATEQIKTGWVLLRKPCCKAEKKQRKISAFHTYYAGLDIGSTSTNAVIIDENKNTVSFATVPTGAKVAESAQKALAEALEKCGLERKDISKIVTTGYGRGRIDFRTKDVTEITCHAKGAYFFNPSVRTIIDIGGQDSKVIRLDATGKVIDFVMNDKCAAGTGRFLEMMAQSLQLSLEEMSTYGLNWNEEIAISSMFGVRAIGSRVIDRFWIKTEDIVPALTTQ